MSNQMADEITVRRSMVLTASVAAVSLAIAVAFVLRGNSWLDYVMAVVVGALGVFWAVAAWDARRPLLVLDSRGARVRDGSHWSGLVWTDLAEIEHLPNRLLHDGHLRLVTTDHVVHVVGLTMVTRLHGAGDDLAERIADLAHGRTTVALVDPDLFDDDIAGQAPSDSTGSGPEGTIEIPRSTDTEAGMPNGGFGGFGTSQMIRDRSKFGAGFRDNSQNRTVTMRLSAITSGANALQLDVEPEPEISLPEIEELSRPEVPFVFDTQVRAEPIMAPDTGSDTGEVDQDAPDPVVGPYIVAARQRLGLSIEQLAARTGLRADVVEAIEVDDFAPCGGDFFARGHIRTLARVLSLDADMLVREYDQTHQDVFVDPVSAYRADMAKPTGGPNWSILVAAVMAVILGWSIVRLVVDSSAPNLPVAPSLSNGSAGDSNPYAGSATPVKVVVTAAGGGARVVIRDGDGKVAFSGSLAFGQSHSLDIVAPIRVQTSDGSLTVSIDGGAAETTGKTGEATQRLFTLD